MAAAILTGQSNQLPHNGEHNKEHKARTQPTNAPDSNPILVPDT